MPEAAKTRRVTFRSNKDVAIHVPDLGKAEEFYSGVLGFQVVYRGPNQIEFDTGSFHLWVNRDNSARSFIPSFDVSDYAEAKRHLEAAGCKSVTAGGVTYYEDPFGFAFDIVAR